MISVSSVVVVVVSSLEDDPFPAVVIVSSPEDDLFPAASLEEDPIPAAVVVYNILILSIRLISNTLSTCTTSTLPSSRHNVTFRVCFGFVGHGDAQ